MNSHAFTLSGAHLEALPSGALWWPEERLLCISDLHLGKSGRIARREGRMLPPYETAATLGRLEDSIAASDPAEVVCLGDSFDDREAAESLSEEDLLRLSVMQAGREWTWVEGNHDPGPLTLGGQHASEVTRGPLTFRHIAEEGAAGEISGHYHPKCALTGGTRPAFLIDAARVVLPAFGAYTGGLHCTASALQALFTDPAFAVLTGRKALPIPLPRPQAARRGPPRHATAPR